MRNFINSKYGKISCVILGAGGLSLLIYVLNRWPKPKARHELGPSRSFLIRGLHSGYRELNRLKTETYSEDQEYASALHSANALKNELQKDLPDLMILQENVENLENCEKEDDAVKILEPALKKASGKPHEAHEIEMLLVEARIYKGRNEDLESALKCKCLGDESLKDARRPLFKAIIYQMLGDTVKAKEHWDEFIVVRDPDFCREMDFDRFKHHVDRLQQANARQNKGK